ncbi:MAG: 4'-phosphopantetheinyl transferase superfamily protein [Bacteroidota bacterium]
MLLISRSDCIRCCFDSKPQPASKFDSDELEVFYAETKDLTSKYYDLKSYINNKEKLRADKFQFDNDRETYISCHALLRLILAKKLNSNPLELSFINGINNKPGLTGNPIYFNISHTRESFAIAISKNLSVGIDLENINLNLNIHSIMKNYFSNTEREFILSADSETVDRFILLWTRKEALLKALGTGILNNLAGIEVSGKKNYIDNKSFDSLAADDAFYELFIYSKKLINSYLSVAIPEKASINIYQLNSENISSYLV